MELTWLHWGLVAGGVEGLGILAAVHAVMHARSSQGAIAWALVLVLFPWVSLLPYAILGRNRFHGYAELLNERNEKTQHVIAAIDREYREREYIRAAHPLPQSTLARIAELPVVHRNRSRLLIDGEETFSAIFEAIASARDYILVQFYIVKDDDLGRRFQQALIHKAREGVRVYFLYDEVGSYALPRRYLRRLRGAGVETSGFNTRKGPVSRLQLNFRNHRKIVVVDGETAFVGGHNVGDEYLSKSKRFPHWRDTHAQIWGPAVQAVQYCFLQDWHFASRGLPELRWTPPNGEQGDEELLVVASGPADAIDKCGMMFLEAIHSAEKRIWIASPYFIPDQAVLYALTLAALRGVDVRIMLPAKPDHLLVYLSSFSNYQVLIPLGVKLFRYTAGFMHQKVFLVDDAYAAVGTANLDNRSFRLNFEITLINCHRRFVDAVEKMLDEDFGNCRQVSVAEYNGRSFLFRMAVRIARLFDPLL